MPAPNYVNGTNGTLGGGSTIVLPAFAVSAGNCILVFGRVNNPATSVSSIADTAGNTYAALVTNTNGGSRIFLWVANNIGAHATNVITITLSASDAFPEACAIQATDQNSASPVSAAMYSNFLVPGFVESTDALVVMCGEVAATGGTWTASAGFTSGAEGTDNVVYMAYRQLSSLTAISPSLSQTSGAAKQMITALLVNASAGASGSEHSHVF